MAQGRPKMENTKKDQFGRKKNQTDARPRLSRTIIESCRNMCVTRAVCDHM